METVKNRIPVPKMKFVAIWGFVRELEVSTFVASFFELLIGIDLLITF